MSFYAVVSLLDQETYQKVEKIWDKLEECCGLTGIKSTPYPHFSWTVAEDYQLDDLRPRIEEIAGQTQPFSVRCSGLGIFSGTIPVVYVPVIKDQALVSLHKQIWTAVQGIEKNPSMHYQPEVWIPHITLASRDVTGERLGCALQELAYDQVHWTVRVDNLSLVCQADGEVGQLKNRYNFPDTVERGSGNSNQFSRPVEG